MPVFGERREEREDMVTTQIVARRIPEGPVTQAMRTVPRHAFVGPELQQWAYADQPLDIGLGQTISQPYMVAMMSTLLDTKPGDKILEIGTGCGYQSAILAALGTELYSVELRLELAQAAQKRLTELGYKIRQHVGDGHLGWPEQAPYDGILVACAAHHQIPRPLLDQLKVGGRLIIPVGDHEQQELMVVDKREGGQLEYQTVMSVRFVPFVKT